MSGLDGLGWPNPEDEPKSKKTMNSQLEIKLAPTPETDAMEYFDAMCDPDRVVEADFARKLERERDEWQLNALLKLAVKQLACMWCGELVHAPTGYEPGTPLNAEQRAQAYQQHVATCPAHPIRDVERERDELREWTSVNGVSSLAKDRDQFRARLREEQQLHVQTLNERDEAQERADTMFAKHVDILDQTRNERDELIRAGRALKTAKGRFHTEQAAINLFELLP